MEKKLYSVALGPISEGKPSKVVIVVANSFSQVVDYFDAEVLSVQLLPDVPVIL